jgi:hypothetical protein
MSGVRLAERSPFAALAITLCRTYCRAVWFRHTAARKFLSGGILCWLWSSNAWAQETGAQAIAIDVRRDESAAECPDSSWFQARLQEQRGEAQQSGDFTVSLSRKGDTFRATIQRWQEGERVAAERVLADRSATCAPLAEAVAVTLAILAEDFAREQARAPEPPPPPPPEIVTAEAAPAPAPAPAPPPPPAIRLWGGVGAGGFGAFISPLAPAFALGATLDSRSLRQGLRGSFTLPQRFELGPGRVVVQAWLITMLSCVRLARGTAGLALCAAFDAGQLSGTSEGFADTSPGMRSYEALGLELQPSWNFAERGRISAVLGGLLPFTRESFSVTGLGAAYVPPAVGWRALVLSELAVF